MELASYLADERWSAYPACTHPLLAALARDVNDHTGDKGLARPAGSLEEPSRAALAQVPHAAQWAREFTARGFARDIPLSPQAFRENSAPFIVHAAVEGIARAYIPQPDQMLRDLLIGGIAECAWQAGRDAGRSNPA